MFTSKNKYTKKLAITAPKITQSLPNFPHVRKTPPPPPPKKKKAIPEPNNTRLETPPRRVRARGHRRGARRRGARAQGRASSLPLPTHPPHHTHTHKSSSAAATTPLPQTLLPPSSPAPPLRAIALRSNAACRTLPTSRLPALTPTQSPLNTTAHTTTTTTTTTKHNLGDNHKAKWPAAGSSSGARSPT